MVFIAHVDYPLVCRKIPQRQRAKNRGQRAESKEDSVEKVKYETKQQKNIPN